MTGLPESKLAPGLRTTHWESLDAARTSDPEFRRAVLEDLTRRYWQPVYGYLRAQHLSDADALDVTQGFFVQIVLDRDLFARADRRLGRFRDFLLQCLKNYLRDRRRHAQALKRCPQTAMLSLERWMEDNGRRNEPPAPDSDPEELFNRKWATGLLERALVELDESCRKAGLSTHLAIFRERVIWPTLYNRPATLTERLAERYGLTNKQVANRTETIRRRFRNALLDEIRLTVMDESEVDEELSFLVESLRVPPR